jgi:hypothetical protein
MSVKRLPVAIGRKIPIAIGATQVSEPSYPLLLLFADQEQQQVAESKHQMLSTRSHGVVNATRCQGQALLA